MSAKEGTRLITKAMFIKVLLNQEVVGRNKIPVDRYYRELIEGAGADGIADELEELGITGLPNSVRELTEEQLGQIYEAFFLHEIRADGYDEEQIKEAREYCFDLKNEDTYVVGKKYNGKKIETSAGGKKGKKTKKLAVKTYVLNGIDTGFVCGENTKTRIVLDVILENNGKLGSAEIVDILKKKFKEKNMKEMKDVKHYLHGIISTVRKARKRGVKLNIIRDKLGKYKLVSS